MMKLFVFLVVAVAVVAGKEKEAEKIDSHDETLFADRDRLLDNLFENYKKRNYPDKTTVQFGMYLINLDLDPEKDMLNSDAWLKFTWTDSRLTWDPSEYGGLKNMRVSPDQLWLPDTLLFNGPSMECRATNAIVYPNGKVLWIPPCQLKTHCNFTTDTSQEQTCILNWGSWTFDALTMGLEFFDGEDKVDTSHLESQKYAVTKNEAIREEKVYPCCVEPYLNLKFTLGINRAK
ncbi:acetylcholine receptor subunit alpha-like 2 [Folsomia candida]|uniref:acetylcholine receptor subunit alpha-like 2 n=1 Tax=Folsomia candida TaxID=158441 RepID=UPI000B8F70D9|nr:acetylcholine receptor subunit alpha-like 2 [Folsomia candida]